MRVGMNAALILLCTIFLHHIRGSSSQDLSTSSTNPTTITTTITTAATTTTLTTTTPTVTTTPTTTTLPPPSSPNSIKLVLRKTNQLSISWTQSGAVDGFNVYMNEVSQPSIAESTKFVTESSLLPGTKYNFVVNSYSGSQFSSNVTATFYTLPAAVPSSASVIYVGTSWINYTWVASTSGCSGYKLDVGQTSVNNTDCSQSFYYATGLFSGTTYTLSVIVFLKAADESSSPTIFSSATYFTKTTNPLPPTSLVASNIAETSFTVGWSAPTEGVVNYQYYINSALPQTTAARSAFFTSLFPGTLYTVTVQSLNAENVASLSVTLKVYTRPSSPGAINLSARDTNQLSITWQPNENVDGFNVFLNDTLKISTLQAMYIASSLSPGYKSTFNVNAYLNTSSFTGSNVTASFYTLPNPVQVSNISANTTSISFSWISTSGGCSYYQIYYDQLRINIDCLQTYYTASDLSPGLTYTISVVVFINTPDDSTSTPVLHSSSSSFNKTTNPLPPTLLMFYNVNENSFSISWTAPSPFGNVKNYKCIITSNSITVQTIQTSALSAYFSSLVAGTSYTVTVQSITTDNEISSPVTKQLFTKPNPPVNVVTYKASTTSATFIKWDPPSGGLTSYNIIMNNNMTTYSTTALLYDFYGLTPGALYSFSVVTVLTVGNVVVLSNATNFSVRLAPLRPINLALSSRSSTSLTVLFSTPFGVFDTFRGYANSIPAIVSNSKAGTYPMTFSGLISGTSYTVTINTYSGYNETNSDAATITVYTLPSTPNGLTNTSVTSSTITLSWTNTLLGSYDKFVFIAANGQNSVSKNFSNSEITGTIDGLSPGTKYSISLYAAIVGILGNPTNIQVTTRPLPVTDLSTFSANQGNNKGIINANWNLVNSPYDYFIYIIGSNLIGNVSTTSLSQIVDLGYNYTVAVTSVKDGMTSISATIVMEVVVPADVALISIKKYGSASITVGWDSPPVGSYSGLLVSWQAANSPTVTTIWIDKILSQYAIQGLGSGVTFNITIQATNGAKTSKGKSISQTTEPNSVADLALSLQTISSLNVSWTSPNTTVTNFELYIFPNDGTELLPIIVQSNNSFWRVFGNLKPGRQYNISIIVVSSGVGSSPKATIFTTKPLPLTNFIASNLTETSVILSWTVNLNSQQDTFVVKTCDQDNNCGDQTLSSSAVSYTTSTLKPGYSYLFSIRAISYVEGVGDSVSLSLIAKPRAVSGLTSSPISDATIRIQWKYYPSTESLVTNFTIQTLRIDGSDSISPIVVSPGSGLTSDVSGLFPGGSYNFTVVAYSSNQQSQAVFVISITYPLSPNITLLIDNTTTSSLCVEQTYASQYSIITKWYMCWSLDSSSDKSCSNNLTISVRQYMINLLLPGHLYKIDSFGIVSNPANGQDMISQKFSTTKGVVKPHISISISEFGVAANDTLNLVYTADSSGESNFFNIYTFTLGLNNNPLNSVNKTKEESFKQLTFDSLIAGTTYSITAITVSTFGQLSQSSSPLSFSFNTVPNEPTFTCTPTATAVKIAINNPAGGVDTYTVGVCVLNRCQIPQNPRPSDDPATFSGLYPNTNYTITVTSNYRNKFSKQVIQTCLTQEAAPESVSKFNISALSPNSVACMWDSPTVKNGIIRSYTLSYIGIKNEILVDPGASITINNSFNQWTFDRLVADTTYNFTIFATTVADGIKSTLVLLTPILPPPTVKPMTIKDIIQVNDSDITTSSAKILLINPFSSLYGDIVYYSLIVTTRSSDSDLPDFNISSWSRSFDQQSPYFAVYHCANLFNGDDSCWQRQSSKKKRAINAEAVRFTLGGDDSCSKQAEGFCNGKLSPSQTYYISLRAYNREDMWTNTPSLVVKTKDVFPVGLVVGVVIAGFVVLAAIIIGIILIIIMRRKKKQKDKDGYFSISTKTRQKTSNPIAVTEFVRHVEKMSADSNLLFSQEYEDLKHVGTGAEKTAAEKEVNRQKNRYTNILPHDASRIKLEGSEIDDGTDYINANWMPGYTSRREFIAAQGPLQSTIDDFWRMTWQYKCQAIIMLTKWSENGREKCACYIPTDNEPVYYADISVQIEEETEFPEWTITKMALRKGTETRYLSHYYYTAWPDFGVPKSPESLLKFIEKVRSELNPQLGPTIVHCSAGVGRTGAFICLDRMIQQCHDQAFIDIYGTVYEMRKHRCSMVQTEEQYVFIHKVICHLLQGDEETLGVDNAIYVNFEVSG